MSNIYYNPEDYELAIIAEVEAGEPYSYDGVVIWRDANGWLFGGTDSTCSCYSPFDGIDSTGKLTRIDSPATALRLLDAKWGDNDYGFSPTAAQRADFRAKVKAALR